MSIKNPEIESIQENSPNLGIDALGDLDELARGIIDGVDPLLFKHDYLGRRVEAVHICGSFAEGTATETFSDLDVRVVLDEGIPPFDREQIETDLRTGPGSEIVPEVAGYLDPHLADVPPGDEYASACIWERGSDE